VPDVVRVALQLGAPSSRQDPDVVLELGDKTAKGTSIAGFRRLFPLRFIGSTRDVVH
jgi:hypothetical protein